MSSSARRIICLVVVLLVFSLACSCDFTSLLGGETATPTRQQTRVLFEDDFSSDSSGWEEGDYSEESVQGGVGYGPGYYYVVAEGESLMWGLAYRSFDDLVIEVEATQVEGGPENNNGYGVGCRVQDGRSGYFMYISGDGFYSIRRDSEDGFEFLVDWERSDAIRQGDATNSIRAVCDGSTLILFVNGERLAAVEDDTYSSGDIALVAENYEGGATEVHFDNLIVREP
jgi:hypothetical protein